MSAIAAANGGDVWGIALFGTVFLANAASLTVSLLGQITSCAKVRGYRRDNIIIILLAVSAAAYSFTNARYISGALAAGTVVLCSIDAHLMNRYLDRHIKERACP